MTEYPLHTTAVLAMAHTAHLKKGAHLYNSFWAFLHTISGYKLKYLFAALLQKSCYLPRVFADFVGIRRLYRA